MITNFQPLGTLTISHSYYNGICADFDFIIPTDTAKLLQNGKLLAKERDGKLYIFFEADETGAALTQVAGKFLRVGLKLLNPYFPNFTNFDFDFNVLTPLYKNSTTLNTLDAGRKVTLVGALFSHALLDAARPVTVTLKDSNGQTRQTDTITSTHNRERVFYDLSGQAPGAYVVEETYPANSQTTSYYCDAEMHRLGVFGLIEIKLDNSFYANPPAFSLAFAAKTDLLKYYLVARRYPEADFAQLAVADAGFTTDNRPEIKFSKVAAAAFTSAEISPALLAGPDTRVVLFKSQAAVPRQEQARTKIQLTKNSEVLIQHLPQIGADRLDGNFIIHLTKP